MLLPLAIEAAAPESPGSTAAPLLKQAAVQLVTRLAGVAAGPFRAAVGALGPQSKARLQIALTPTAAMSKQSEATPQRGVTTASPGKVGLAAPPAIRPPSIALKSNFGGAAK